VSTGAATGPGLGRTGCVVVAENVERLTTAYDALPSGTHRRAAWKPGIDCRVSVLVEPIEPPADSGVTAVSESGWLLGVEW